MDNKKTDSISDVDFKEQTPAIQIENVKNDPNYEKAFLSDGKDNNSEFSKNTAAED